MSFWPSALFVWIAATSLAWVAIAIFALRRLTHTPSLDDWVGPPPDHWPKVSIIVPACNEQDSLEPAMRSLLELDYPNLEIILVEDRSTDRTPEIADRLAAEQPRLRVVHIDELPDGWLGKVHALHRGVQLADGDWYLFTDADIRYRDDALRRAIRAALHQEADQLSLIPQMHTTGFWHGAAVDVFVAGVVTLMSGQPDQSSGDFVGIGAFNMVRASTFDATEGFEWLRMEIADDAAVGLMMNRHGAHSMIGLALDDLEMDAYGSLGGAIRGLEKNGFPIVGGFSYLRVLAILAATLLVSLGTFAGLALPALGAWPFSLAALAALVLYAHRVSRKMDRSVWTFLVLPAAHWLLTWATLRSALLCALRGGIEWRGTLYPTEQLEQNRRVDIL